jgi:hypothetical protein
VSPDYDCPFIDPEAGAPGAFAALSTEAGVIDAVRAALGDAAADALLAATARPEPESSGGVSETPRDDERDPNATTH